MAGLKWIEDAGSLWSIELLLTKNFHAARYSFAVNRAKVLKDLIRRVVLFSAYILCTVTVYGWKGLF